MKSYVHKALASGLKGVMVATSGNGIEATTRVASCDDPRRDSRRGGRWTGETKREYMAVLKRGLSVKLFNSRSAKIG